MRKLLPYVSVVCLLLAHLILAPPMCNAAGVPVIWDWSAYINGATYNPPALPPNVNSSGFDFTTGLGTITFQVTSVGANYVGLWLDPYIDEGYGIQFNEQGSVGAVPGGLSWQLADPTVTWPAFSSNALDNTNYVPTWSLTPNACCDVSMAMIWNFSLTAGQTGTVTFTGNTGTAAGGILSLYDQDANLYYNLSSSLNVGGGGDGVVPEPGYYVLTIAGILAAVVRSRLRKTG